MDIRAKSIYERRDSSDGFRILVDNHLPISMDESSAQVDLWLAKIVPGYALRKMFDDDPERWDEFREGYFRELDGERGYWVDMIISMASDGPVTLFYSTPDSVHNYAVAIKEYIEEKVAAQARKAA